MESVDKRWQSWFKNNLSYKLVALVIALILWLTILGRRDFVLAKDVPVDFVTNSNYAVVDQSSKTITLKVTGPRQALQRFADTQEAQMISVNLGHRGAGKFEVSIPVDRLDLPFGVKLISVKPKTVQVEIADASEDENEN